MRFLLIFFLIFKFSFSQGYEDAYNLLKTDFLEEFDREKIYKTIQENRSYAISSYLALKTASFLLNNQDITTASHFFNLIDEKALQKADIPFYLYIKYRLTESINDLKKIALGYPESYYGYKLFTENVNLFSEEEKVNIIENLIKKRMKERATFLIFTLSDIDAINYIKLLLDSSQTQKIDAFIKIPESSPYYIRALKYIATQNKEYESILLSKLSGREYEETLLKFCEKSFYMGEDITGYVSLMPESSKYMPDIKWYEFLQFYINKQYDKAIEILQKYGKYYDDDMLNYWLYLTLKRYGDIQKAQEHIQKIIDRDIKDISDITYYKALTDYIFGKRYSIKIKNDEFIDKNQISSILESIKRIDYKMAYIEGVYLLKREQCKEVYTVMPEIGVRCLNKNSPLTYIKPFGNIEYNENLIYSIIRQESFFDPFAISSSNAVGIAQFIPKTARYFADKLKLENFDMTNLFNPDLAIRFSVEYIKQLDKIWNGNIIYIIASYNAGENAVKRFLDKSNIEDPAEFIELFPYRETRDYVKKVLRNYMIYDSMEQQ